MSNVEQIDRLADRFFGAIEQGDMATLAALYTSDAVVWHNSDNREQPQAENVAMLGALMEGLESFAYNHVRRSFFDGGFVQQHEAEVTTKRGERFKVHACMVVTVRDGKVARIDEYLDSVQLPGSVHARISGQP